jgi:hypothetical protein
LRHVSITKHTKMEEYSHHLDRDTYLEIDYEVTPGEPGDYYTPPVYSDISIQRIWIANNKHRIEVTEINGGILNIDIDSLELEIYEYLRNQ